MRRFSAILRRELRLTWRQGSDAFTVIAFYIVVVALFPLGVGPEAAILERMSAGIVWIGALLAVMLSVDRLFQSDYEDGGLDLLVAAPWPLELIVLAKSFAHWLTSGLPILVVTPVLGLLLNMEAAACWTLVAAMALGGPTLSLIGTLGAALALGARRSGLLIALLVLPLAVPVLIFGVAAVEATALAQSPKPHLLMLAALLAAALALCPRASAAALQQAVT